MNFFKKAGNAVRDFGVHTADWTTEAAGMSDAITEKNYITDHGKKAAARNQKFGAAFSPLVKLAGGVVLGKIGADQFAGLRPDKMKQLEDNARDIQSGKPTRTSETETNYITIGAIAIGVIILFVIIIKIRK